MKPVAPVEGAAGIGLELATFSVTVDPTLINVNPNGLTYVDPRQDAAAALKVHHTTWAGSEAFTATVEVPKAGHKPKLSADDALGAVSFAFTAKEDKNGQYTVNSPITWFDTATGETAQHTIKVPTDGGTLGSARLTGGLTWGPGYLTATYLNHEWAMTDTSLVDMGLKSASTDSHQGQLISRATPKEKGPATLYVGEKKILEGLTPTTTTLPRPEGYLVVDWEAGKVWVIRDGAANEIDTSGCILEPGIKTASSANGYFFVGQLLIDADLKATCLTDLLSEDAFIDGVLSDGRSLIRTTRPPNGTLVEYGLISADATSASELGAVEPMITVAGHLLFRHGPEGQYATAFSEQDLRLPE